MEPKMTRLKLLSTAALMALALPLAISSEAFAQHRGGQGGQGGFAARGGGPSASIGAGGGMRGGGVATAGPRFSGGGGMTAGTRFSGGGSGPGFSGRVATSGPSGNWQGGNRNWQGGNWQGGNRWAGGYGHRRGGGFWPGVAVGAAIG